LNHRLQSSYAGCGRTAMTLIKVGYLRGAGGIRLAGVVARRQARQSVRRFQKTGIP
jgi:hypothetical protein